MQIGVIDLGPLGSHIVRRLLAGGHECVVYDRAPRRVAELAAERAYGAASLPDLAHELDSPRIIWMAGPADTVEATIADLRPYLEAGDVMVDCADSYYVDDIFRANTLAVSGIHYLDVGVNGSSGCAEQLGSLTVGGDPSAFRTLDPIFRRLTPAYLHCGPSGAGHFVGMVHRTIERCLAVAYAEGFSILRAASAGLSQRGTCADLPRGVCPEHYQYDFKLEEIAETWRRGSLVASPLLDIVARALVRLPGLQGTANACGKPRDPWPAMKAAVDEAVSVPVLASAVCRPVDQDSSFASRLLAAVLRESEGLSSFRTPGRRSDSLPELHS